MGKDRTRLPWRLMWIGLGVAATAAAIFIGAALSSTPPKPVPEPSELSAAVRAEDFARQASQALSDNETSTAVSLAQKSLALDANNATANRVVTVARQTADPAADPSDPEGTSAPARDDSAYAKAVDDLASLLPVTVSGWSAGQVVAQSADALVTFEPDRGTPAASQAVRAIVNVHDLKTADKAEEFVGEVDKKAFADDATTVKVGVIPRAYFGTDGTAVAVVAFARGRFAFEVLVNAPAGVDPAQLKTLAATVAGTLPAAR